jgi:hypothetical protein
MTREYLQEKDFLPSRVIQCGLLFSKSKESHGAISALSTL